MHDFPHPVFTSGWYQVGWSAEFEPGAVVPMRYFDTELVCWRDGSGVLHVNDAVCPHMGGHLGHGGKVEKDCIVCPFHGWKFGPDGANVAVPYSRPSRMEVSLHSWEAAEIAGLVLVWYGASGEPPAWQPPSFVGSGILDGFWDIFPATTGIWRGVRFPPHLSAENGCDAAHFRYVHGAVDVPELAAHEASDYSFRCEFTVRFGGHRPTTWATPHGPVDGRITTESFGLGFTTGVIDAFDTVHTLQATTPIDQHTSDHRCTAWVPKRRGDGSPLDEQIRDRWASQQVSQHAADLPIWENAFFIAKPLYTRSEATVFRAFRRWADRFYAEAARSVDGRPRPARTG